MDAYNSLTIVNILVRSNVILNYINFEGKDEWVISRCILLLYYPVVNDIKDETLKREYAKKSSDIIDFYTNKYGVKLNGFEEKVDELRKFAGI